MVKEFEIQGRICGLPTDMTEEEFWHKMIGFIEGNGWLFGGGLEKEKISGCVFNTSPEMTNEQFEEVFLSFVKRNGWTFEGSVAMTVDGQYPKPQVCNTLMDRFNVILHDLGMERLEHPLFYHAPVAIRYEIGEDIPVYLERDAESERLTPNPAYVQSAFDRAFAIYQGLPAAPSILRIDGYPAEETTENIEDLIAHIRERTRLPAPLEQVTAVEIDEDGGPCFQVQFYWDLSKISFQPECLLREIILGDIGGWNGFSSRVFLAGPGPFLYHLYDDRGLDVLGGSRELLRQLYQQYHDWILEYNLEEIDRLFTTAD